MLPSSFMPHGYCYQWSPSLLFWQVTTDLLIGIAYLAISVTLWRICRQRRDISFNGVALSFAAFILACGATHFLEVWNIWHADYWVSAGVKIVTATASVGTAFYILRLRPAILALPNPGQLASLNRELEEQVSKLQATEMALRTSEEQFRTAFDFAGIGIAIVGLEGRWVRVNPRVCEITGFSESELLATTFQAITHPDDLTTDLQHVRTLLSGERRFYQIEKRYLHKSGHSVSIRLTAALVRDTSGEPLHFVSQIEDISDRKRLEEQLLHAQKMEAVGQLAGGIAHDYNNILTSTMMQLSILLEDTSRGPELARAHSSLMKDANRAAALTRQLLTFSRRQVMQSKVIDLVAGVENIIGMLQRLIGENIDLRIVGRGPVWVEADVNMMDQIVTNLTINARDAIGAASGTITVSMGERALHADDVRAHPEVRPGAYAFIAIQDTGEGMDEDTRRHLFEPFFTTKPAGKGTGLGLATAYGIARQHGGWIHVSSRKHHGSTFTVFLPLARSAAQPERDSATEQSIEGRETILLVEDEEQVLIVARASLARLGYRIIEARDGVQALELWSRHRNEIQLLFTDMVMPHGVSGWDLARKLQQDNPSLPVVLTSGYSVDLRASGVPAGVEFIQKPYELSALGKAIRRALTRSAPGLPPAP